LRSKTQHLLGLTAFQKPCFFDHNPIYFDAFVVVASGKIRFMKFHLKSRDWSLPTPIMFISTTDQKTVTANVLMLLCGDRKSRHHFVEPIHTKEVHVTVACGSRLPLGP